MSKDRTRWTEEEETLLRELWPGHTTREVIAEFKRRGYGRGYLSIGHKATAMRLFKTPETVSRAARKNTNPFDQTPVLEMLDWLPTFDKFERIKKDTITICCDTHIPLINKDLMEKMCLVSRKFKSQHLLIIGDFFDQAIFSPFVRYFESKFATWDLELEIASEVLKKLLGTFTKIYVTKGNHDERLMRLAFGKIKMQHIFKWMDASVQKQIVVSDYPFSIVSSGQEEWRCTHAKEYSRAYATAVPKRMAEKHESNVVNAGGHLSGVEFTKSGRWAIGLGLMGDPLKFEYIHYKDTTHPKWNPSFMILHRGFPYVFHQHKTDWDYWLKGNGK